MNYMDCQSVWTIWIVIRIVDPYESYEFLIRMLFKKLYVPLLLQRRIITQLHRTLVNNARTLPKTKNARKRRLTEATYTKEVRFCGGKKKTLQKWKWNLLFITENTHKGNFYIFKNCWVPQAVALLQW